MRGLPRGRSEVKGLVGLSVQNTEVSLLALKGLSVKVHVDSPDPSAPAMSTDTQTITNISKKEYATLGGGIFD